MADILNSASGAIEGIPGFGQASTVYEMVAPDIVKVKDPFFEEVNGKTRRRKPPPGSTDKERKQWKKVTKKAWHHDKNFCNCTPFSLGLGIIPIVTILPVIGPWICYSMHSKLVYEARVAGCPKKILAKMTGNMTLDFLISLCPVLGVIFCWANSCSTKNAALFDTWLRKTVQQRLPLHEEALSVEPSVNHQHTIGRPAEMSNRPQPRLDSTQPSYKPPKPPPAAAQRPVMRNAG